MRYNSARGAQRRTKTMEDIRIRIHGVICQIFEGERELVAAQQSQVSSRRSASAESELPLFGKLMFMTCSSFEDRTEGIPSNHPIAAGESQPQSTLHTRGSAFLRGQYPQDLLSTKVRMSEDDEMNVMRSSCTRSEQEGGGGVGSS